MNISAIQTFLTVVRTGNLNRAAEQLNVTQSAVTARLDTLEQTLGAKLLIRSRKGANLTKHGFAFLEQAEVIVRSWENARARSSLPRGVTRLFSFVCHPSLWTGLGENWVAAECGGQGEMAIETWSGLYRDASRWLQSGLSDAALQPEPLNEPGLESRVFDNDRLIQVVHETPGSVPQEPNYIYVDYGPAIRIQLAQSLATGDTATISFSNPDWALAHLLAHGGQAFLPERIVTHLIQEGILHKVKGAPGFTRRTYLSWRKSSEANFPWLAHTSP